MISILFSLSFMLPLNVCDGGQNLHRYRGMMSVVDKILTIFLNQSLYSREVVPQPVIYKSLHCFRYYDISLLSNVQEMLIAVSGFREVAARKCLF